MAEPYRETVGSYSRRLKNELDIMHKATNILILSQDKSNIKTALATLRTSENKINLYLGSIEEIISK